MWRPTVFKVGVMGKTQRGVALLMVVVTVAIISAIAIAMVTDQTFLLRRIQNTIVVDTAVQYGLGGEQMAALALQWDSDNSEADGYGEVWLTPQQYPVDEGMLSGAIGTPQGRFNLNNLLDASGKVQPNEQAALERLLTVLNVSKVWVPALIDWMDSDQTVNPNGAEDGVYQSLEKPYLAANRPLRSVQELRMIQGVTEEVYERLAPFVTALPTGTPLNVNFASAEVLAAYLPEMAVPSARKLVEELRESMAEDEEQFKQKAGSFDWDEVPQWGVQSQYFDINMTVVLGGTEVRLYSVLNRNSGGDVSIVRRGRGLQ
ncbi:general secretion pathway protein K [gamma proteobacterium HTCC5015]|nr:general secretion pathway protein K [gamma proteobacterium HTCC5015]